MDLQKNAIFGENSCPGLPGKPELLRLGEIRSATGTKRSIEMCSKVRTTQYVRFRPLLALKAIRKAGFFGVVYNAKTQS